MATAQHPIAAPAFAVAWMPPGCVSYVHQRAIADALEILAEELRAGGTLPPGMSADVVAFSRSAWALAKCNVAGSA